MKDNKITTFEKDKIMEILDVRKVPNDCSGDYFLVRLSDGDKKEIPADALSDKPKNEEIATYLKRGVHHDARA